MNDEIFYDNTFEENDKIVFLSLTNSAKQKILNYVELTSDYNDIEDFLEKNYPQDKKNDIRFFRYEGSKEDLIGVKLKNSSYILLLKRSIDRRNGMKDNYFVVIDIQKRNSFLLEDEKVFQANIELKLPVNFDNNYREYSNSYKNIIDDIEYEVLKLEYYKVSLSENEEYKKWYSYLTLLEKLIDEKDFFFETEISYNNQNATVELDVIENDELRVKIKKARNQEFLFYEIDEVDTKKPIHEWDKRDNKSRGFGKLISTKGKLEFKLNDDFIRKFTTKEEDRRREDIISTESENEEFRNKARDYIIKTIKKIDKKIIYKNRDKTKIDMEKSINNLKLNKSSKKELLDLWESLDQNEYIDKEKVNDTLSLLKDLIVKPNSNNLRDNNFPNKLILRVSYFRDQFQLKTLKKGLDKIQTHILKPYLFGNQKLDKISDDEFNNLEIEYLSKILNDKQKEAVKKSLISKNIFMIQGPPGTGKTEVISEIAYQEAIRGQKVLITSQANMAVDNAIQRLNHPSLYPVRIIRKDYEPEDGDSLPVEANIDKFYQDRIIVSLSDEIKINKKNINILETFLNKNILNDYIFDIISKLDIKIPTNLDLSDTYDRDDFIRILNNDSNKEKLRLKLKELQEISYFDEIRDNFLEELRDNNKDISEEMGYLASNYLNKVNVYGATLFETGKYSFKELNFDVVIVDEVSKAMPPELVLPILKANKLILVGDHKQLPPIIKDISLEDLAQESKINLEDLDFDITVFEKLIENNPNSYVMLDTQYRMHPHIQFAINQFYQDEAGKGGLKCGLVNPDFDKCHNLQNNNYKNKHLIWLKTKKSDLESKPNGSTSFINKKEIEVIKDTLIFLNKEYSNSKFKPSIGVITFYGRQLGELTKLEKSKFWNLPFSKRNFSNLDLKFGTVDRFQGQEKDIIIVSLVRNNKQHNIGFAKKPNRVNVAFSRARKLLIIVGNVDNFTFAKDKKSAKQYRQIFNIAKKFGMVKGV